MKDFVMAQKENTAKLAINDRIIIKKYKLN
jgi:hypothetical protein